MRTEEEIKGSILAKYPDVEIPEINSRLINFSISLDNLHGFCEFLKGIEGMNFNYLFCLTAVDWPDGIEMIYHLQSSASGEQIVVRSKIGDKENPSIDTVCDLWATAEFHEREVFDLFGVKFNNHPDLRRIFLDDDWEGHPLRKDYEDNINIINL